MATDLAQQLQQVAAKAGVDTKRSKGKASLLYDSRAASDIGVEQVYDIACQGEQYLLCCSTRSLVLTQCSPESLSHHSEVRQVLWST